MTTERKGRPAPFIVSAEELYDHTTGRCLACRAEADGVEPDACEYECEGCGEAQVYGCEELLVMGLLRLSEGEEE